MENVIGVNEKKLDLLTKDIIDYADRINGLLNQVNVIYTDIPSYYKSDSGKTYIGKVNNTTNYFAIINQNIISYSRDFVNVKARYQYESIEIADDINRSEIKGGKIYE